MDEKLQMVNFCQLQVLLLAEDHYAFPRLKGVTAVTWRCRVQVLPVTGDKWGNMVGDPTILVAHWSTEPGSEARYLRAAPGQTLRSSGNGKPVP